MPASLAVLEKRPPHDQAAAVGRPALSKELFALSRLPAQTACAECSSCVEGLNQAEAERRLAHFGTKLSSYSR
jgi:hypothetical protein